MRVSCLFVSLVYLSCIICTSEAFTGHSTGGSGANQHRSRSSSSSTLLRSTPFDASLYDGNDGADDLASLESANPFSVDASPLAVSPGTKLVLGLNKYSHDTTLCAADAKTGEVLFAMSKERLTRRKHDSGNVASLVEKCLEQLDLDLDSIERVVVNNHHHRVLPLEDDLGAIEWEEGLQINDGTESGYSDEENLLSCNPR